MGSVSGVQTVAENAVTRKKLRVKILVKKPENGACKVSEVPEVKCVKKVPSSDVESKAEAGDKKLKSTLGTKHVIGAYQSSKQVPKVNCLEKSSVTPNRVTTAICDKKLNPITGCKRRSDEVLENHEKKRLKMDGSATLICHNILTKLMKNKRSGPFHTPVKPDVWGLHDYFDIIKKPMDLGTVKQKLLQNKYLGIEQFEADMRLTFSNAMLYNPPGNWYHESAKELLRVFDRLWKPIKVKIDREHRDIKQKGSESSHKKTAFDVKDKDMESVSTHRDQFPGKALPQKEKSSEDLKKLSVEGQHSDLKAVKDGKPKHKTMRRDSLSSTTKSYISVPASQSACPMPAKVKCENAPGRKIAHDDSNAVKIKRTSTLQRGSNVQGSDREYHGFDSFPTTTGSLGAAVKDVELSPSRALRVAKLMERYSETILKAQHHTLLEQGGGTDAAAWQKEKVMLQRRQHEEKARIETQIEAVKSGARFKTESDLKKQRQAEREAARIALRTMKQSVFVDDNLQVLKDLEAMIGCPLVVMCHGDRSRASTLWSQMKSDKLRSPLERLGLYIKEEYQVGNENDYVVSMDEGWEEGEII